MNRRGPRCQRVEKASQSSAARRRRKKMKLFSGGVYVGKTLCAERASNRLPWADDRGAERSEIPLAEKASAFFDSLPAAVLVQSLSRTMTMEKYPVGSSMSAKWG